MGVTESGPVADWGVRGSYFEGFNCEAICPCRSVSGRPGGSSSAGECFGVAMTASKGVTAIGAAPGVLTQPPLLPQSWNA
jgi:hypothetical protein